jgi:hypothetical protein
MVLPLNKTTYYSYLAKQREQNRTEQLQWTFVLGQSSSGKSSLLNLILGEELLPHHVLNATSTICELKYGKVQKLVVHYKYDKDQKVKTPSATIELKTKEQCGYTYQQQIASFVYLDQKDREKGSDYDKVELFWPHELLQVYIDYVHTGPDEFETVLQFVQIALRSHGTIEIGRIRAPFAGRIRDQKKLGLFFGRLGF